MRALNFFLLFLTLAGCSRKEQSASVASYVAVEDTIQFRDILERAQQHNKPSSFLVISRDQCRSCLMRSLSQIKNVENRNDVFILLLGSDTYELKRLNAIYRGLAQFIHADKSIYEALGDSAKYFASTIVIGAKFDVRGKLFIYYGSEHKTMAERISAVTEFLLNPPESE